MEAIIALFKKACTTTPFNVIIGIIWFVNFVGSTGYLFYFNNPEGGSTSAVFAVLNILVSLFLLFISFAGYWLNKK